MGRELFIDLGAEHTTTRLTTDDSGNLLVNGVAVVPSTSLIRGSGVPSFAAVVGTLYTRTDAAANQLYVKETGSGTAGWQPVATSSGTFNVKDYGATGDGTTDDYAAIASAISDANIAGGGAVYFPPGIFQVGTTILVPSNVRIVGCDKNSSIIRKVTNMRLFDFTGASNASRCQRGGMIDIKLSGAGFTGELIRCKWADHLNFDRVWCYGNGDRAVYLENCWDTYFNNVEFDTCSGADGFKPSVQISSNADDSSNVIVFNGCRWENFIDGALWISSGAIVSAYTPATGANPAYGVYLTNCKMETPQLRGLMFMVSSDVGDIHFDGMYIAARGLYTGIVTGRTLFSIGGASDLTFEKFRVRIDGVTNPTVDKIFAIATSLPGLAIRDIFVDATQLPNTGMISWDGGTPEAFIENVRYKVGQAGVIFAGAAGVLNIPTIASAATTMTIPRGPKMVTISGTTTITTIPAIVGGCPPITFKFSSTAAMTDGGNLLLASSITGALNTTITLYCDGTNWIEVCRSVN